MKKLKVGVIGVGVQGEKHIITYKENPFVEKIAIADINEERLKYIAEKYHIASAYTDYVKMLEKENLDLVSVATPDFLHKEPVLEALKHYVNVIVEKPLATNVKDAEDMVSEAKRRKLILYINFANRWCPPFAVIKERINKGELGEVLYAYLRLSDTIYVPTKMIKWANKTTVAFFLMSHTADLARWFFNDEVTKVRAWGVKKVLINQGVNTYDYIVAVLSFRRGGKAVLESSWILPESMPCIVDFKVEIIGTKGATSIDTRFQGIEIATSKFEYPRYLTSSFINGKFYGFCKDSINHVIECLVAEKEPLIKPEDGLMNTKILCAITKSLSEDKEIKI